MIYHLLNKEGQRQIYCAIRVIKGEGVGSIEEPERLRAGIKARHREEEDRYPYGSDPCWPALQAHIQSNHSGKTDAVSFAKDQWHNIEIDALVVKPSAA